MINNFLLAGWTIKDQENKPGEITLEMPGGIKCVTFDISVKEESIIDKLFDGSNLFDRILISFSVIAVLFSFIAIAIWG